jgi:hypothetical protein
MKMSLIRFNFRTPKEQSRRHRRSILNFMCRAGFPRLSQDNQAQSCSAVAPDLIRGPEDLEKPGSPLLFKPGQTCCGDDGTRFRAVTSSEDVTLISGRLLTTCLFHS